MIRGGIFFLLFLFPVFLNGQKSYSLSIIESGDEHVLKHLSFKTSFPSVKEREKELNNVLVALWKDAYLAARYDSILQDSISLTAYLNPGIKHKWAKVKKGNVDEDILSEVGF